MNKIQTHLKLRQEIPCEKLEEIISSQANSEYNI